MTQSDIYNLINKSKKGLTSKDINKKLNISLSAIHHGLLLMFKAGELRREPKLTDSGKNYVEYLYFINGKK